MIKAKVFGKAKGKSSAKKLLTKINRTTNKAAKDGAGLIRREAIRLINNTKGSGVKHSGLSNTSSSPGQDAPASQSGELAKSIRRSRLKPNRWAVWSNVVQAWWSVGLPHSPNLSAERPFFQVAARNKKKSIIKNTVEALRKLLK